HGTRQFRQDVPSVDHASVPDRIKPNFGSAASEPGGGLLDQIKTESRFSVTAPDEFPDISQPALGAHSHLEHLQVRFILSPEKGAAQSVDPIAHAKGAPVCAPVGPIEVNLLGIAKRICVV